MFVLSKKAKQLLVNALLALLVVGALMMFLEASIKVPVMELNPDGHCLRVLDGDGAVIPNGCKDARNGRLATEHRYVGK